MNILSGLYGRIVQRSRAGYARHPERRRRLRSAVISVGNLSIGGSGKTPVVAAIARLLLDAGRRPAVLSRGYKRRVAADGVVVVSDRERVLVPAPVSGDEPQMLARGLPGVPVLVCAERYLAGRLAEEQFAADVCVLDDGFQHWQLARDVDLVVMAPEDLDGELLPFGRLREPLSAALAADAVLVPGSREEVSRVREVLSHPHVFRVDVRYGPPALVSPYGVAAGAARTAIAVAAIARPRRFFEGAVAQGWELRRTITHRDHHWFTARDVERAAAAARETGADMILTTEKDAVRLDGLAGPQWVYLPMHVAVEPADVFREWLLSRLGAA